MLTIRLTRKGKKNQPFFRIVVTDKRRSSKGGRAVEDLGYVNPLTKKNSINKERALHWLKVGAQASPRVHNLLVSEKIIEAKKIKLFSITKKAKAEAVKATAVVSAPAPADQVGEAKPEATAPALAETPAAPVEEKLIEAPKEEKAPETPVEPAK